MQELLWRPTIQGQTYEVKVKYHSTGSLSLPSTTTPVLAIGGFGERSFSATNALRGLQRLGMHQVYSVVLPFSQLPSNTESIHLMSEEVPALIARHVIEETGAAAIDLIGRSQGGAVAIVAAHKYPELFRKVALVAPFGLTSNLLGDTIPERRRNLLTRQMKNALAQRPLDSITLRSMVEVANSAISLLLSRKLPSVFEAGVILDLRNELIDMIQTGTPTIGFFAATNDVIFPLEEYQNTLPDNVEIHIIHGHHATSGSSAGQKQLSDVVAWLEK